MLSTMIALLTLLLSSSAFGTEGEGGVPQVVDTGAAEQGVEPSSQSPRLAPAPDKNGRDAAAEVDSQQRFNELRRELLDARREFQDDRVKLVDWWLYAVAIFLTFFATVVAFVGYFGFRRFREIEAAARQSMEAVKEQEKKAGLTVKEIEEQNEKAGSILKGMSAETTHDDPDAASRDVRTIRQNPAASLTAQAVADAILLQQQKKTEEAIEKWHSIVNVENVAEEEARQIQAQAWFSIGYLHSRGEKPDWGAVVDCYTEGIALKSDDARAYNNRGAGKSELGQHEDAIVDLDRAIELNPKLPHPYNHRGRTKARLGRIPEAREDYQQALALAQEAGNESLVAEVKDNLERLGNNEPPCPPRQ